jgi:putative hydrolase of the HAD superfamily
MTSQIKLFIFDMGGVLARNVASTGAIAASFGISEEDFFRGAASDLNAAHTSSYNLGDVGAIQRGEIDSPRFWENFAGRTGIVASSTIDPWYEFFNPVLDSETAVIIGRLKTDGYRVVCGTNTLEPHYRKHKERGDYSIFDAVYTSHLMGVIKPDPAFWRFILEKENVKPEETFFVDDSAENIRAAEKTGLRVHHFTGAEKLSAHLEKEIGRF